MAISDTPRSLVYKDFEKIEDALGNVSEKTLEREFYERLIVRPFIKDSNNPSNYVFMVFNNARYVYYLVVCEENSPSLNFNYYLTKTAEGIEDIDLKCHILAATMALVYNWLYNDEDREADVNNLIEKIYLHFSEEKKGVTTDSIKDFHSLLLKNSKLPTIINSIFEDIRDIEDAANNAPVQDVARGIDYLMECFDPQNGTNGEHYLFLNKILKRFDIEKNSVNDTETIEQAKAIINRRLQHLMSTPEPEPFSLGISLDDIITLPEEEESEIDPDIKDYIGWIADSNKAAVIINTLKHFMNSQKLRADRYVLMPLCAAFECDLITKPSEKEYKIVFEKFPIKSTGTQLNNWVSKEGADSYKNLDRYKPLYNIILNRFKTIKDK